MAERDQWTHNCVYRASGSKGVVERNLNLEGEWLRGNSGVIFGCKLRQAER